MTTGRRQVFGKNRDGTKRVGQKENEARRGFGSQVQGHREQRTTGSGGENNWRISHARQ